MSDRLPRGGRMSTCPRDGCNGGDESLGNMAFECDTCGFEY